mmetsp:Transcript_16777/g.32680  ORF Transcript_16777/g.32680 Transcript_16777/m.32680 type:complete len:194 (+) Transcript_16777:168-749(+)|eukprot:CAMPEP_0171501104 /NCGR_PEP_ID=MMETSP0958-20121227/9376_1 /TAXON_ID=87120 /ORGANISM="Aurantiochytrium limacinum, Strain ATCCMYA-1381" /LENGTH=193 /DNA_ID=CAMNT_0012035889 /DNA_START=85 /DNA_END=666 /DNA_ORIENTATION=-
MFSTSLRMAARSSVPVVSRGFASSTEASAKAAKLALRAKGADPRAYLDSKAAKNARTRKWRIVEGDMVVVRNGVNAGKSGRVTSLLKAQDAVVVENVNVRKVESFDEVTLQTSEKFEPAPIAYSNVNHIDPKDGRACRVRLQYLADGTKVRVSARSGEIIPYPPREAPDTREFEGDTPADLAVKRTYFENAAN